VKNETKHKLQKLALTLTEAAQAIRCNSGSSNVPSMANKMFLRTKEAVQQVEEVAVALRAVMLRKPCEHPEPSKLMVAASDGEGVTSSAWHWCPRCGALASDGAPWRVPTGDDSEGEMTTNPQDDMHRRNVAKLLGITVEDVTPEQRQFAKLCAFGTFSEQEALENLRIALQIGQTLKDNR